MSRPQITPLETNTRAQNFESARHALRRLRTRDRRARRAVREMKEFGFTRMGWVLPHFSLSMAAMAD